MTVSRYKFHEICHVEDLWEGEMDVFSVKNTEILLIKTNDGFKAFQAQCPHQDIPLVEGKLMDGVLTCRAHLWQFDPKSGLGINPTNTCLKRYPVKIRGSGVWVGDEPIN